MEENNTGDYGKFKFELHDVGFRTVVIPAHITLTKVHFIIQHLFDWEGCHLWKFEDREGHTFEDKSEYNSPYRSENSFLSDSVCLSDVLPERGGKLFYTYDYGDCWEHVVTRMADPKVAGCYCVKTEGPDGIEDCGGVWGFEDCEDEWYFPDVEEITARLKCLRLVNKKSGTGILKKENEKILSYIAKLNDDEWNCLAELGSKGFSRLPKKNDNLWRLLGFLHGTSLGFFKKGDVNVGDRIFAENAFLRSWRRDHKKWEAIRKAGKDGSK